MRIATVSSAIQTESTESPHAHVVKPNWRFARTRGSRAMAALKLRRDEVLRRAEANTLKLTGQHRF